MFSLYISRFKFQSKFFTFIILLLLLGGGFSHAHSGKAKYRVIIDTDAAVDDLRAICLFLASPEFEVLAVTTSDGVIDPELGLIKVRSLLKSFGHEGIPTGAGRVILDKIPPWRSFNQKVQWGEEGKIERGNKNNAVDSILSALELEEEPVLFVCLGGMTNLAQTLNTKPQVQGKIARIIWYNDSIAPLSGTNFEFDEDAANDVLSTQIAVEIINKNGSESPVIDPAFLQSIAVLDSPYAKKITTTHNHDEIIQRIQTKHLKFWDDLLPVYLLYPGLFVSQMSKKNHQFKSFKVQDLMGVKAKYVEILISRNQVQSRVFEGFPDNPVFFAHDVRPYMKSIINKHGNEEWRIGVLTNEIHGHLGIYAIIGAKMGLRARQYFHINVDDISIISYAGSTPPLSCLNDGLQVSTGGTIGHGLITVPPNPPYQPKAVFTFKRRTVSFKLKDDYWNIIRDDIKKGIELYGINTEDYWKYVRRLALTYWLEWDRTEIFEIVSSN